MTHSDSSRSHEWRPDHIGGGFEVTYVDHPDDYSGCVRSVVVRLRAAKPSGNAVLYVHGFSDYFIQKEMAEMFAANGYDFYAVDLRKYGRALTGGQKMFEVRDMHEYFPDIDAAVDIITRDGIGRIILLGHSTGGLTTSLYMTENPSPLIKGLMLNSPFLDWNMPWAIKKGIIPVIAFLGRFFPKLPVRQKPDTGYAETLSADHNGEWVYRTDWKPDILPDPDMGWVRAIDRAQKQLRRRRIDVPVLLMRSAESVRRGDSREKYYEADAILDVDTISYYGLRLAPDVTEVTFQGALHDIALSRRDIRDRFYRVMLDWMSRHAL